MIAAGELGRKTGRWLLHVRRATGVRVVRGTGEHDSNACVLGFGHGRRHRLARGGGGRRRRRRRRPPASAYGTSSPRGRRRDEAAVEAVDPDRSCRPRRRRPRHRGRHRGPRRQGGRCWPSRGVGQSARRSPPTRRACRSPRVANVPRPDRFAGLHFFNPPQGCGWSRSSPAGRPPTPLVDRCRRLVDGIGKDAVMVQGPAGLPGRPPAVPLPQPGDPGLRRRSCFRRRHSTCD